MEASHTTQRVYYRLDLRYKGEENWIVGCNVLPTLAEAFSAQKKYEREDSETRILRVTITEEEIA